MKVLIAGASGLIGSELIENLFTKTNYQVNILTRNLNQYKSTTSFPVKAFYWNPAQQEIDIAALEDVDIVINLAGANISDSRWNDKRKKQILDSRVNSTKLLVESLNKYERKPKKFIQASAVGIYKDDTTICDENSTHGEDFLAEVCKQWEYTLTANSSEDMKIHILRIGPVLSAKGGMLKKLIPIFDKGYGSVLGTGKQYISWIHLDDIIGAIFHLINNDIQDTVFNATAPSPVTNEHFSKVLAKYLGKKTFISPPDFIIKLLVGEMSTMILNGQNAVPTNLLKNDYEFKYKNIEHAMNDILQYKRLGENIFTRYQWVKMPLPEVFDFFSSEKNLEVITPESLKFKVVNKSSKEIEKDTIIKYQLKLYQFPLKWTSHITAFEKNKLFIDKQITGPYKKWEHLHEFKELHGGTLIKDTVVYKVPLGRLGELFAGNFVKKDITKIFNYRNQTIHKIFSEQNTNEE